MSTSLHTRVTFAAGLLLASAAASPAFAGLEFHVNLGSDHTLEATDGTIYSPDQPYGSGFGYVGGSGISSNLWFFEQLVGTDDPVLYYNARRGDFDYRFDVPNGSYVVTLHMANIHSHGPGGGFDAYLEGEQFFDRFDPWLPAEKDHCYLVRLHADISDGRIDFDFDIAGGSPVINAIDVEPWSEDSSAPSAPDNPIILDGYRESLIYMNHEFDGDVAKIHIERSNSSSGPWDRHETLDWVIDQYADTDVTPGTRYHYRVLAEDVFGNVSSPSRVISTEPRDVRDSELSVYEILIDEADWQQLNLDPESNDRVPATFITPDTLVPECEVRYRGNSSRRFRKKGWKVFFPSGVIIDGVDRLNLTASYSDPTLMLNVLGFGVFEETSIRTPRREFCQLQVNGKNRGVLTNVEQIGERFLTRWGLDPTTSMYRVQRGNMALEGSLADYEAAYEKLTNLDEGYDDFIDFVEMINNTSDADFPAAVSAVLDIDTWLDWYVVQILLSNDDFTHRDHYFYWDPAINKWTMFVWDMDGILTLRPLRYILTGTEGFPDHSGYNVLVDRMMNVPQFRDAFALKIQAALESFYSYDAMSDRIDDVYNTVVDDALRDRWKLDQLRNARFAQRPEDLKNFIEDRVEYLTEAVQDLLPSSGGSDIRINEFLASNNSIVTDEFDEFDDYIEIYNAGSSPINVGGMFLTDDLDDTQKFELPSVSISAGEFLMIWCDAQTGQGSRHAPFRLSSAGETIGIYDRLADGNTLLDSYAFGPQIADVSEGRIPDGSGAFQQMATPTPGAPNQTGGDLPPEITAIIQQPDGEVGSDEDVWVCAVLDDTSGISSVRMFVSIEGGSYSSIDLLDDGAHRDGAPNDGIYGNLIDGRTTGTDVLYYVEVRDSDGRVVLSPIDAPSETYGYTVGYTRPLLALNELMASNTTTIQDDAGEFDDWIEIYNYGSTSVDLGTIALANRVGASDGWRLPSITLDAGDFLLVWADQDETQGSLHTSFKLSAVGEGVGLLDMAPAAPLILDEVTFPAQSTDISWARESDGTGDWRFDDTPSPGTSNGPGGFSPSEGAPDVATVLSVRPNPARAGVMISLASDAPTEGHVRIYDVSGRMTASIPVTSESIAWNGRTDAGTPVRAGVYFVRHEAPGVTGTPQRLLVVR